MSATDGKSPADFLRTIKGKQVLVKLNSGVDYRGAFGFERRPPGARRARGERRIVKD